VSICPSASCMNTHRNASLRPSVSALPGYSHIALGFLSLCYVLHARPYATCCMLILMLRVYAYATCCMLTLAYATCCMLILMLCVYAYATCCMLTLAYATCCMLMLRLCYVLHAHSRLTLPTFLHSLPFPHEHCYVAGHVLRHLCHIPGAVPFSPGTGS